MSFRIAFLSNLFVSCLWAGIIDKVVAIVNQEPILASQVNSKHDLNSLIDDEIIRLEIKKMGLFASEIDIDQAILNITKQNRLTPETFEKALAQQGMSLSEYRAELRRQIHKSRLIHNKVKTRVLPSTQTGIKLQAEQAIFKTKAEAEKALKNPNTHFEAMGTISREDLIPAFSTAVFSLKEGQTSSPLKSPQGFHLIRVRKRIEIPLEKVDKQRYEQELEIAFKRYVKELEASAYIERK